MNKQYSTNNLSLAASILATRKAKFIEVVSNGYSPADFIFEPYEECIQIEKKYINNSLILSVRDVETNIKILKSQARKGGQPA